MTDTQVQTKGHGMLYVHALVWENGLGKPETPKQWHKALMLPENYEIDLLYHDFHRNRYELTVLSDAIPASDAHVSQTVLTPKYQRNYETNITKLVSIDIDQWDGKEWKTTHATI